ncbi:calcium-transporting ATPase, putative [Theileria annulata]|uniref:P-type Cu(+) transporter n=1 Tax=Theileria annulata TaxID=5874 RepID=Q4UEM8_THEAN|nr:calcium-transporting ATPase, putative [Theileria annulata]CAI74461.1 calcium-transporting ATPase, putative [Theileria annulata]|eukprot:XP_952193.1 calcium-transporting ATPase, putative [Theileria annulata]
MLEEEKLKLLESPHVYDSSEVLKHYSVNLDYGLNDEQVILHRELLGSHSFLKPKKLSLLHLFIQQFDDLLVKILLSAAIVSFFFTCFDPHETKNISSFIEPIVILFILILNALVGVWQEANAEKALDALKKLQPTLTTCLRNGVWTTFDTENLVVGDIVKVKNGDKIPADLRLVKVLSTALLVEQSQLTGESLLIYKTTEALDKSEKTCDLQTKRNILFGSTTVCSGTGIGVVVAVGMDTEIGTIQSAVIEASTENTTTPLQKMLHDFGNSLSKAISVICLLVWLINVKNFNDPAHGSIIRGSIYYFKIAIALAVAAIPEGLPAVITTCLALGTRKMAKKNAIVRKLPSIETLGCTTVICSDKTGTLTTNKMTTVVVNLFNQQNKLRYIHMPHQGDGIRVTMGGFGENGMYVAQSFDGPVENLTHTFLKCASLCSDVTFSTLHHKNNRKLSRFSSSGMDDDGLVLEGEPTEVAIIEMVNNLGKFLTQCDSSHLDQMGQVIFSSPVEENNSSNIKKMKRWKKNLLQNNNLVNRSRSDSPNSHANTNSSAESNTNTNTELVNDVETDDGMSKVRNETSTLKKGQLTGRAGQTVPIPISALYRKYLIKEATLEFCRSRKMMSVICTHSGSCVGNSSGGKGSGRSNKNKMYLYSKGAPESILEVCTSYMLPDGSVNKLSKSEKTEILDHVKQLANEALRVLAFSYRSASQKDLDLYNTLLHSSPNTTTNANDTMKNNSVFSKIEKDMVFLGLVGIMDPPRPEVKDSISKCMRAGIRVIMITGDNKLTAEAIARKVGIIKIPLSISNPSLSLSPANANFCGSPKFSYANPKFSYSSPKFGHASPSNSRFGGSPKFSGLLHGGSLFSSLTGKEFESLTQDAQRKLLTTSCLVFSRTEPKHKQSIVSILKDLGEIVAMTGDGVNDAPALKMADIGISMGINGTEVAKEASDMILADDNFKTIVSAIEEGRCIYSNMKAFIRYLISSNIGEVVSIFMTAMLGIPEGMLPVQLLWVNLVTDGPPATALGFNPPDPLVMKKGPRHRNDKLIDRTTLLRYMVIGLYVGLATCGIFIQYYVFGISPNEGNTLISLKKLMNWGNCMNWEEFHSSLIYDMSNSCEYFTVGKVKASTLSLTTLVILEMFNALNALSEDSSILKVPPWSNPYLICAIFFSILIHCFILYIPFFSSLFNVVPLDVYDWKWVLIWSFPVLIIDECFKLCKRSYKKYSKPSLQSNQAVSEDKHDSFDNNNLNNQNMNGENLHGDEMWMSGSTDLSFGERLTNSLTSLLDKVATSFSNSASYDLSNQEKELAPQY